MKVKIDLPQYPKGYEISITGLNALLINGEEVEVSDEVAEQYQASTGTKLSDVTKDKMFGGRGRKDNVPEPSEGYVEPADEIVNDGGDEK